MKRKRFLFVIPFLILAFIFSISNSQMDTVIENKESDLDINNNVIPVPVMLMEPRISENSGLIYFNNLFWTFNDSGGENEFYSFDSVHSDILQKFIVANASNIDWEDITQDDKFIYIGDFGNNFGNRKDLVIYKIPKKFISRVNNGLIIADEIRFSYEDQLDFIPGSKMTEYDCEAFLSYNDNLYLFTKDWIFRRTKVYKLPKTAGDFKAELVGSYNINSLVTAAEMSPDNTKIAILGYKEYTPFLILLSNFTKDDFFGGSQKRYYFYSIQNAQTEGITFTTNSTLYFSCESSAYEAQLFRVNL